MAANLELNITLKQDGKMVAGFPLYRRVVVDELQQFSTEQTSSPGTYVTVPSTLIDAAQAVLLSSNQPITVRLNGQSNGGIALSAGGLLLILDATLNAGASTNITVDNSSGNTATLSGLVGGT